MEFLVFLVLIVCVVGSVARIRYYRGRPADDTVAEEHADQEPADREPVHAGQRDWFF